MEDIYEFEFLSRGGKLGIPNMPTTVRAKTLKEAEEKAKIIRPDTIWISNVTVRWVDCDGIVPSSIPDEPDPRLENYAS